MKPATKLNSFRIKNFKAIRDSKTIKLSPLTALIGNNGSGKSSIVEALEMLQAISLSGVDKAMESWHGFEHVWNQAVSHDMTVFLHKGRQNICGNQSVCLQCKSLQEKKKISWHLTPANTVFKYCA